MATIHPPVLIVRLDAIGDAITTVPLIAALKRYGMRVGAVLTRRNAEVFSRNALDAVHIAPSTNLLEEIRAQNYGLALIATEKPQAYRIARAARIPQRIGFHNGWGKPLKTLWVRQMCTQTVFRTAGLDPSAPHECSVLFRLAQGIVPDAGPTREISLLRALLLDDVPERDGRIAMQITPKWERLGANESEVIDLVRLVAARGPLRLLSASSERDYAARIAAAVGLPVETFDTLTPWKNAIVSARGLIAPDSGAVHLAGMTGTPVVACFAASHFALQRARWSPWASPYRIVNIEGARWPVVADDALAALVTGICSQTYTG